MEQLRLVFAGAPRGHDAGYRHLRPVLGAFHGKPATFSTPMARLGGKSAARSAAVVGHCLARRPPRQALRRLSARPPRNLGRREPHHRHRRPAQRRQVDPVQRADQERRARGELPVRHDRAERRRGRRARRAARELAELLTREKIVPATVSFVDIAGLVRGASEGAGAGNKFLANIRESAAICQVIRAFSDPDVVHVEGKVRPSDDIETINTELILADLQTVDKALPRLEKEARIARRTGPGAGAAAEARSVLDSGRTLSARRRRPGAAARADPAHHQAVPVRLQRRRGRAGQRRRTWTSCARWSPRPRRCSWTPRSSRS